MTAIAIPEQLDEFVYDLVLKRKSRQYISDLLMEVHQVKASRMAVASCFARAKNEKLRCLFELTDGASGLDGGGRTLDRLFRESQAFALEAVEGHQLNVGLRAIDQQLRILKIRQSQLRAEAAAEKQTGRSGDPANTLQRFSEPRDLQGVGAIMQGLKDHLPEPDWEAIETPAWQVSPHEEHAPPAVASTPTPPSDPTEGEGGEVPPRSIPAPVIAASRERVPSPIPATPERNKPCPCGSQRKYKKCCFLAPSAEGSSP